MRSKRLFLVLLAAMLTLCLTACGGQTTVQTGQNEAESETGSPAPAETPEPPSEPTPEPCPHEWSEATYHEPAVCALCGEIGEVKPDFFTENGLEIYREVPSTAAPWPYFIYSTKDYDPDNPDTYKLCTDGGLNVISLYDVSEDEDVDVPEGYQEMIMEVVLVGFLDHLTSTGIARDNIIYTPYVADYYTGAMFPFGERSTLEYDGESYSILWQGGDAWNAGDWEYDKKGNGTRRIEAYYQLAAMAPENYDGLVLCLMTNYDPTDRDLYEKTRVMIEENAGKPGTLARLAEWYPLEDAAFLRFGLPAEDFGYTGYSPQVD